MAKENKSKSNLTNNFWSSMKKVALSAFRLRIIFVLFLIIVILISSLYILKGKEIAYAQDDPKNVPAKAANFTNNVTIDSNGKIATAQTPLELWNELVKNGSEITKYLDSAEDLSKLMNAQLVTQYMDTRDEKEIDEDIDWDSIYQQTDSTDVQGIIKMKRADSAGNETRMTYASLDQYLTWMESYNETGDANAKKNLLSHFTLEEYSASENKLSGITYSTSDVMTDISQRIIDATKTTPWAGKEHCQKWVRQVYNNAGLGNGGAYGSAYKAYKGRCISTDRTNIPIGASVYCTGQSNGNTQYGHVGIYIGNGMVMDNVSTGIRTISLNEWIASAERHGHKMTDINGNLVTGWLGWGWQSGSPSSTGSSNENVSEVGGRIVTELAENTDTGIISDTVTTTSLNNFLFIGDSILEGLKTKLEGEGATVRAEVGKTAQYFVDNWDSQIGNLSMSPAGIYLILGQNSCGYGGYQSGVDGLKSLVSKLQAKFPNVKIYVNSVLPTKSTGYSGNKAFTGESYVKDQKKLNEALQQYCSSTSNVEYVNVLNGYEDTDGYAKPDLTDDGLHPNASGREVIFNNIKSGITGGSSSSSSGGSGSTGSGACALVATFQEIGYSEATDDPEESIAPSTTEYSAVTTRVYYQNMTSGYTMPFNYLWTWLVLTENKDFVMDLADLVYNSEIEFTVYEKYNGVTNIETVNYTRQKRARTYAEASLWYNDVPSGTKSGNVENSEGKQFYHTYKTTTVNQTANVLLTKANVWMLDYELDYNAGQKQEVTSSSGPTAMNDEFVIVNQRLNGEHALDNKNTDLGRKNLEEIKSSILDETNAENITWNTVRHTYNVSKVNQSKTTQNIVSTQDYVTTPTPPKEKTEKDSEEPNFVTVYLASRSARQAIKDLDSWLFEYLEMNDDTKEMVDLTKYLLYMAEGKDYGVSEFDFDSIWNKNVNTVNADAMKGGASYSSLNLTADEVEILYQITSLERGNGTQQQQEYVVSVILNRVLSSSFPDNVRDVVYANKQFEPVSRGLMGTANPSETTKKAVENVIKTGDKTGYAVFFMTPAAAAGQGWLSSSEYVFLFNDEGNNGSFRSSHNFYTKKSIQKELQQYCSSN